MEPHDPLAYSGHAGGRGCGESWGQLLLLPEPTAEDFEPAFATMLREGDSGFLVVASPLSTSHRAALAGLALQYRLPGMFGHKDYIEAGGL